MKKKENKRPPSPSKKTTTKNKQKKQPPKSQNKTKPKNKPTDEKTHKNHTNMSDNF